MAHNGLRKTVDEINSLFPSIYKKYHARVWHRMTGSDLTVRSIYFLKMLAQIGPAGVGELARGMNLTPSTVSTLAKRIERQGLIHRERAAGDERRVQLTLSRPGRRLMRGIGHPLEPGLLTTALRRMPRGDRAALLRGLQRLDAVELPPASHADERDEKLARLHAPSNGQRRTR